MHVKRPRSNVSSGLHSVMLRLVLSHHIPKYPIRPLIISIVSGGRLRSIHHFDSKADVETYIRSIHVPASFVNPGCFMSNLKTMLTKVSHKYCLLLN
jgi:hypothetical protein